MTDTPEDAVPEVDLSAYDADALALFEGVDPEDRSAFAADLYALADAAPVPPPEPRYEPCGHLHLVGGEPQTCAGPVDHGGCKGALDGGATCSPTWPPPWAEERRWATFPRVDVDSERLRVELADGLGIPAPYVDAYDDRIEVVGLVNPDHAGQCAAAQAVIDAHDPTQIVEEPETLDEVAARVEANTRIPDDVKSALATVFAAVGKK